jgi:hypothetical protein
MSEDKNMTNLEMIIDILEDVDRPLSWIDIHKLIFVKFGKELSRLDIIKATFEGWEKISKVYTNQDTLYYLTIKEIPWEKRTGSVFDKLTNFM